MQPSSKKIFFVAPFAGESEVLSPFLAGSKKIRLLLQILATQGYSVYLVNSAPAMGVRKKAIIDDLNLFTHTIKRLTVASYARKRIGRLRNIFETSEILDLSIKQFGIPNLIWCYNGYSFEMRFARQASKRYKIPVILEFEDWHFARSGPLNPKALLDYYFWMRAIRHISFCYAVNPWLASIMRGKGIRVELLPGVISDEVTKVNAWMKPAANEIIKVGYFGGLSEEKGAGFVLKLVELVASLSLPIHFDVTGTGNLNLKYLEIAARHPEYLRFHGVVCEKDLCRLIGDSHILLNPHEENNGVLPFKLLEGVAAGRPILSGALNLEGTELEWVLAGIKVLNLDPEDWLDVIMNERDLNFFSAQILSENKLRANSLFSREQLSKSVCKKINSVIANRFKEC